MLMEMAGSRSCRGSAFHEDGPDEQNARGPSVEVDVRGTNSLCCRTQLCAAGDDVKWCTESGEIRWCQAVHRLMPAYWRRGHNNISVWEEIGFEGLCEDVDGDGWVASIQNGASE